MSFHHLAHFEKVLVKVGEHVKRGQLIGYVGTTGASNAPHLHYEIAWKKPMTWEKYTSGMTKEAVAKAYIDPERYIDKIRFIPAKYDRFTGYGFLDKIQGKNQYHPGVDINSGKDGWADFNSPILSPVDGVIIFADFDGHNGGWGDHIWIEEIEAEESVEFGQSLARMKFGFYIQVEAHGELWVVREDGKREHLTKENVFDWIQKQAVGISNEDLSKVPLNRI